MKGIMTEASPASSVTYGNIVLAVKEFVISNFPENFFKYDHVTSELAYRNIRRQLAYSKYNDTEFTKRGKPLLVVRPQVSVPNDGFLYDIPMLKNYDNVMSGADIRALYPVLKDSKNNFEMMYRLNRDRIEFEVTVHVSTYIQQIDTYKYMANHFVWNRDFSKNIPLEMIIPNSLIQWMGKATNIIHGEPTQETSKQLLTYLQSISGYPITYKLRNSNNNDEYFMYYVNNVLFRLTDLSIDEGVKKGMVDDYYAINFRIAVEFNIPGAFFITSTNPELQSITVGINSIDINNNYNEFIPFYTQTNIYTELMERYPGFKLMNNLIIQAERSDDEVFLRDILDSSIYSAVKNYISEGNPIGSLVQIVIMSGKDELKLDTDYIVNFTKLSIVFKNAEIDKNYRILIFMNNIKISERLIEYTEASRNEKTLR